MDYMIFANIAWHKSYDGKDIESAYTTSEWKEKAENRYGELLNFEEAKGRYYGYVSPNPPSWKVDLSRFGVNQDANYVDNIIVIWTAPHPDKSGKYIVGWYKNARMYSELQSRPKPLKEHYLFEANVSNSVLLSEHQRRFLIEKQFRTLWYAEKEEQLKLKVFKYIEEHERTNVGEEE